MRARAERKSVSAAGVLAETLAAAWAGAAWAAAAGAAGAGGAWVGWAAAAWAAASAASAGAGLAVPWALVAKHTLFINTAGRLPVRQSARRVFVSRSLLTSERRLPPPHPRT